MAYTWLQFKNKVKELLTDISINDDVAVRAIAEYVWAEMQKAIGNLDLYRTFYGNYLSLRSKLLGYSVAQDATTLLAAVKELLTDVVPSNETAVQAVADYVKFKIEREVNHDLDASKAYYSTYLSQRNRLLGFTIILNATDLRAAVNKLITVDSNRIGIAEADGYIDRCIAEARLDIQGFNTFIVKHVAQGRLDLSGSATKIDRLIRQGVIDVQHFIPNYRQGHQTVYSSVNLVTEGSASKGRLPDGGDLKEAWLIKLDEENCQRWPFSVCEWENRQSLICGQQCVNGNRPFIAVDPHQKTFYIYPLVTSDYHVLLEWDGTKLDFADGDNTPFDEAMADVVADYVRGNAGGRNEYPSYFDPRVGSYVAKRRRLLLSTRERNSL